MYIYIEREIYIYAGSCFTAARTTSRFARRSSDASLGEERSVMVIVIVIAIVMVMVMVIVIVIVIVIILLLLLLLIIIIIIRFPLFIPSRARFRVQGLGFGASYVRGSHLSNRGPDPRLARQRFHDVAKTTRRGVTLTMWTCEHTLGQRWVGLGTGAAFHTRRLSHTTPPSREP